MKKNLIPLYDNSRSLSHIIQAQQFDLDTLFNYIFPLADAMPTLAEIRNCTYLHNKRLINWFEESSTRTHGSFAQAMNLLGGQVSFSTENAMQFSSRAKGESITDTIKIWNGYYADVLAGRFARAKHAEKAARVAQIPIINAGDGNNQHPTQALLDIYTIYKRFGRINGIRIAMVGDLDNGRTVRSLSYLLGKFKGVKIYFVAPPSLRMGDDIKEYLDRRGIKYWEVDDIKKVAGKVDVVYMTRIQTERGSSMTPAERKPGLFSINHEVLDMLSPEAIIMHPLPRGREIPKYVDSDPRAYYFIQAQNGLFIRMALLIMILKPDLVPHIMA
ncbi:MAG: aspartate carbamoyltransferase [Patescibacteria group bacterium]